MSDMHLELSIKEENISLFKRCVRKLLEGTFIVGDKPKDKQLYTYLAGESNRQEISDYFRMIGFDVLVDTNVRIAMLVISESDDEEVGLKQANLLRFSNEQYHLLIVLWEIYLENLGYHEENLVLLGDLIDKLKAYEVNVDRGKLFSALDLLKRYSLIDFDKNDRNEDAIITLYPSLQFGWNTEQFTMAANEYITSNRTTEQETDEDDTALQNETD